MIVGSTEDLLQKKGYEMLREIGEGGYGTIYLVRSTIEDKLVAAKILKTSSVNESKRKEIIARLQIEFNALQGCKHPNVIEVYEFFNLSQTCGFTMEYLEGQTLQALLDEKVSFSSERKLKILYQVALGLQAVHEKKVIHRDLTPSNIFVTTSDVIKLIDFGVAKQELNTLGLTKTGDMIGTRTCMSPEQSRREKLDSRSDIYSFGVLAFQLFAGRLPFEEEGEWKLIIRQRVEKAPSVRQFAPDVPKWLEKMIATCLEKDRDRRYGSMLEVVKLLIKHCEFLKVDEGVLGKLSEVEERAVRRAEENEFTDNRRKRKAELKRAVVAFTVAAFMLFVSWTPLGGFFQLTTLRTLFAARGVVTPPEDIVIVGLDDITYQKLEVSNRSPFPRRYLAEAIERIHAENPAVLIMDTYFQKEESDSEANMRLANALASGPTTIVKWEIADSQFNRKDNSEVKIQYYNDPLFANAAKLELPLGTEVEADVVSKISLHSEKLLPPAKRVPVIPALEIGGVSNLHIPGARDLINFYGPPNTIPSISLYRVLRENIDFKNKIVLFGYKSSRIHEGFGSKDYHAASGSFQSKYYGVEVQATIVGNLVDGSFLKRLKPDTENAIIFGLIMWILILVQSNGVIAGGLKILGINIIWCAATAVVFLKYNYLLPGTLLFIVASFFACLVGAIYQYLILKRKETQAEQNLGFKLYSE